MLSLVCQLSVSGCLFELVACCMLLFILNYFKIFGKADVDFNHVRYRNILSSKAISRRIVDYS